MAFFEARADLLSAASTRMEKPLGVIGIGEKQTLCLVAKEAIARFFRNWHEDFSLPLSFVRLLPNEI
jgi:hypothetical protein